MTDPLIKGREIVAELNPNMEEALDRRYGELLPGVGEIFVRQFGAFYGRDGLPMRDRYIVTIAACTALGGQTKPQLKVNIAGARKAGLSREEIAETILHTALYGGMPAAVNALNAALEVFEEEGKSE